MDRKVLVLGLDGGTWRLLDRLIECGKMENLNKLKSDGMFSKLISSIPPTTFPAWKCYSTGKNPGKLGVFGMFYPDFENERITIPDSRSFKSREIFDIIGDQGYKVGIINMPTTEPVKRVNGFMVGGPFSSFTGFTYPKDFESNLVRKYGYKTFMEELLITSDKSILLEPVKKIIGSRFDLLEDCIKDGSYHFLHATIFHIDTLQHFLWGTNTLEDAWAYIDQRIGDIVRLLGEEWVLIMISDHGFTKTCYKFYVNNWLKEQGFLVLKDKGKHSPFPGLSRDKAYRLLKRLRLLNCVKRIFGMSRLRKIARSIPSTDGKVEIESLDNGIDWDKTVAISNNYGIYLKGSIPEVRTRVIEGLVALNGPDGKCPVRHAVPCEELYWGPYKAQAPTLHLVCEEHYEPKSTIKLSGELFSDESGNTNGHHLPDGLFLAYGKRIELKGIQNPISIMDIAPTVLEIMGLKVPRDIDGSAIDLGYRGKDEFEPNPLRLNDYEEGGMLAN